MPGLSGMQNKLLSDADISLLLNATQKLYFDITQFSKFIYARP